MKNKKLINKQNPKFLSFTINWGLLTLLGERCGLITSNTVIRALQFVKFYNFCIRSKKTTL